MGTTTDSPAHHRHALGVMPVIHAHSMLSLTAPMWPCRRCWHQWHHLDSSGRPAVAAGKSRSSCVPTIWASEHTAAAWGHGASRKGVEEGMYAILSDGLAPTYRHHSLMRHHITSLYMMGGRGLPDDGGRAPISCREAADALDEGRAGLRVEAHSLRGLGSFFGYTY